MWDRRTLPPLLAAGITLGAIWTWAQAPELPAAPIQPKVKTACMECHDSAIIVQQRLDKRIWTKEVDKMIRWGAVVQPEDRDAFIDYLSTNFGADKPPLAHPYADVKPAKSAAPKSK